MQRLLGHNLLSALGCRALSASGLELAPNAGRVVSWMAGRGFGFIEDNENKKQHFVHYRSLKVESGGFRSLSVGQEVEFDVTEADGRTRAENVTAIGGGPLPSGERPPENAGGGRGRGGRGRGGRGGGRGRAGYDDRGSYNTQSSSAPDDF